MKKKILILGLALGGLTACQKSDDIVKNTQIADINPSALPSKSQTFIESNFRGEVVTDAFKVTGTDNLVTYEAFMSNNTNLVFQDNSTLMGFGNINSRMEMENEMFSGGMQNMGMHGNATMHGNGSMHNGGMMGNSNGQMMGHGENEFRGHPDATPVELSSTELPASIMDYVNMNYPDKQIIMAFDVTWEDNMHEFHVLVQDIGGMLFDKDGNFTDMIRRGAGHCNDYEEVAITDLPETILAYINTHYPDKTITRVRLGSHENSEEIQVMIDNLGILIFDSEGNFLELSEQTMSHHG